MKDTIFLENEKAKSLYLKVRDLPIVDYHCHLSPEQIANDEPFSNIGELWLAGDHYKWRLMRQMRIDESLITGEASYYDKFVAYAEAISLAAGNPLYHWTMMELAAYFNIHTPLSGETAQEIWEEANKIIEREKLSPKKMIAKSNVIYIATTDDPADTLDFHHKIANDSSFDTVVAPTFRTDKLVSITAPCYDEYIKRLSKASGVLIRNLSSLEEAIKLRLNDFCAMKCRFSDVGIEAFPKGDCDKAKAEAIFADALCKKTISSDDYQAFLSYIYCFLGKEYNNRGITMQLHIAVKRNSNSSLFSKLGVDSGGDCMADPVSVADIISLLDKMNSKNALPETLIYTLNPSLADAISTVAGSFKGVRMGAAWWFCDHKGGIEEQILRIAQTSTLATFTGMLTDSRSFLSYPRHDYFRRIFCNIIGKMLESGEYLDDKSASELVKRVCLKNSMVMAGL